MASPMDAHRGDPKGDQSQKQAALSWLASCKPPLHMKSQSQLSQHHHESETLLHRNLQEALPIPVITPGTSIASSSQILVTIKSGDKESIREHCIL